jgi:hypothetical protein
MAGLRYWDGTQWQTLLGGPPTYAFIGSTAPTSPKNGMIWVQPIDPIVDLFSPDVLTEPDAWAWVGFGYQWPGLSFIPEAQGMRLNWNPAPAQPGNGHQLGAAPFTGTAYANHQLLAQATVVVSLGSPDVRLAQAFTKSTDWITEKDTEVTVTMPIIWQDGMNKFIGIESQTNPGPGTSVLVKDIHLYDLTSSPPSPMRVWSEALNLWLPINDGLVQRAGDRMVGSLRFDTIDSAFGQPTVTGLPTPIDLTDAVPLGFLNDVIDNLPDPGTGTGALIVSETDPGDPGVLGAGWINPTVEQTYPEAFEYGWPGGVISVPPNVHDSLTAWSKCRWVAPASGVLRWSIVISWSATGSTDCYIVFFVNDVEQPAATLASTPGGSWVSSALNGLIAVDEGSAYEMRPGVLLTGSVSGSAFTARLTAEFIPDSKMARVNG